MITLAHVHFLRPWWLLLIPLAFALWHLERLEVNTTSRWRTVMDPALLAALTVGGEGRRWFSPGNLVVCAWMIGIVAVAGPTWRQVPSPFAQSGRPAMFVLKVTPSMLGRDLPPTRLDRAREKMADLLSRREGAPTGLIAYAGSAHLVLPPTPDASVVTSMARALAPAVMPVQGDALAAAIALAQTTLRQNAQGGSIVVFADTAPVLTEAVPGPAPVTLFAMRPPGRARSDPPLRAAASQLHATLLAPTVDTSDVDALAARLAKAGPPPPVAGEAPRWQEAGWWLTPLLALLVALWFRRGWVLS